MSLAITITGKLTIGQGLDLVTFKITTTGTYTQAASGNGDVMNFSTALPDAAFQGAEANIQNGGSPPLFAMIKSLSGIIGADYEFIPGTTIANGKLKIGSTTYNTELGAAAAYPEVAMAGIAIFQRWL